jgi:osmoprotectant transport system permease protein
MSVKTKALVVLSVVVVIAAILAIPRHRGRSGAIRAAFDAEFLTRPDGYQGICKHYGFEFPSEPLQMDPGLMYRAVADGAVDVIDAFATDGRIPAYNLMVLEDDKGFFPPYYAAPLVRAETLQQYPIIEKVLNQLAGKVSDTTMQQLNFEVDEKGRKARDVARELLESLDLIQAGAQSGDGSAGSITIGGKQFTEQEILGEIIAILIEADTDIAVRRKLNLGGTMICFNALKAGDLDLYPEYTGTGLMNILKRGIIRDPNKAYETVQHEFQEKFDLVWLKPFGFNNTYTLTMRKEHANELGISTISDLASYINNL